MTLWEGRRPDEMQICGKEAAVALLLEEGSGTGGVRRRWKARSVVIGGGIGTWAIKMNEWLFEFGYFIF